MIGVRLVATDLDGTLLRRDGTLSERTVAAVDRAARAGLGVVLVTARPPRWVDDIAARLACHPLAICSNGALIYDVHHHRLVAEHPIPPDVSAQVLARLRAEIEGVVVAVEAGMVYGQEPAYTPSWPPPPDALVAEAERLLAAPVAKMVVRHGESGDHWELVDRARRAAGGLVEVTSSGPGAPVELAAPGVSKAFALEIVAGQLGVKAEEVVAFGDMPNDLPMLAWAGCSIAPANAHPDVLAVVDRVTADCDLDGVAMVIEEEIDAGRWGPVSPPTLGGADE
ncbi:MAG TPA: HAD family hydrolase [Acidimicrobiales bacterium]|nr:HAD family hydrolase [Acidimicrobiales bacterium]